MKRISLFGSTGSIGVNCLNVVEALSNKFAIQYLSTHSHIVRLFEQAKKFKPRAVAISGLEPETRVIEKFQKVSVDVFWGRSGLLELAQRDDTDLVVNAVVGAAGLEPTLLAIDLGKKVALANKETLVIAGGLVMSNASQKNVPIIPIDSEHSAIFQCLRGETQNRIRRLILTASGGPFWKRSPDTFCDITVKEALIHPNWKMGKKITIDSATMMNKGLELIEAHWLFQLSQDKIDVVIHPQSIIHSMVEFVDGSIKAQLGIPDMKIPIQYALTYPDRERSQFERIDFDKIQKLEFNSSDLSKFRTLDLARESLKIGGTAPAVLNAANEIAVDLFMKEKITFDQIPLSIEDALEHHDLDQSPSLEEILLADEWARDFVFRNYS